MARKVHPQKPHLKAVRKDNVVTMPDGEIKVFLTTRRTFMPKGVEAMPAGSPSISRAKRFMRTGSASK
jgi:hypothetical protein